MKVGQKIVPHLWFDADAEEAVAFYGSVFERTRVLRTVRYGKAAAEISGRPEGSVLTMEFEIEGQRFVALNGGPMFRFTEAVSFMVTCAAQAELDTLWQKLLDGGQAQQCGWLKDKYGLSWQIVPAGLDELLHGADAAGSERATQAMLQMVKLDLAQLRKAYEGR